MHPNENPYLVLVSLLLSSNNYHFGSCSMTMALTSKNKLHFINGVLPRPPDQDHNSIVWDWCNTIIMSWINISVELKIAQSILWMDIAIKMWIELKDDSYQGDVFRISEFQTIRKKYAHWNKAILPFLSTIPNSRNCGKNWIIFVQFLNVHVTFPVKPLPKYVHTKMDIRLYCF